MPALATRFGCIPRVYQTHHTASLCRFAREVSNKIAPGGVQDAFCQMSVPHHVRDAEVFKRDSVVARNQPMRQLVQKILAPVGDPFMLALKRQNHFTSVCASLFAPGKASLQHSQFTLRGAIQSRMPLLLAVARGDQTGDPNVYTYIPSDEGLRCGFDCASEAGVPLVGAAGDAKRFDLPFERAMPADSHTTDTRESQPPSVDLEAISVLLEAETGKAVAALKPREAGRLASLDASEERLKRLVQISDDDLQDVTMDTFGVGVAGLLLLHQSQLSELTHRLSALCIGISTFRKTLVIPATAGLERARKQPCLRLAGIQTVAKGLDHHARMLPETMFDCKCLYRIKTAETACALDVAKASA